MTTKANIEKRAAMYLHDKRVEDEAPGHKDGKHSEDGCPECRSDIRRVYPAIASAIYDSLDIDGLIRNLTGVVNKWDRTSIPGGNLGL